MKPRRNTVLGLLALLACLPYLNSFPNAFVSDEQPSIVNFPDLASVLALFQSQPLAGYET